MALRIGIPIYYQAPPNDGDIQRAPEYVIPITYVNAVLGMGASPLLVPGVGVDKLDIHQFLSQIDGLLLAGGSDVDSAFYNEAAAAWTMNADPKRDETEMELLRQARAMGIPVLGICRGCQVINITFGGTLIPDIPHFKPGSMKHSQTGYRYDQWHTVKIAPGSKFARVIGDTRLVTNSLHHQAVDQVAEGFVASAWNETDGITEAIESVTPEEFCLGVQFHPEDMWDRSEPIHNIFKAFAEAAQKYAKSK